MDDKTKPDKVAGYAGYTVAPTRPTRSYATVRDDVPVSAGEKAETEASSDIGTVYDSVAEANPKAVLAAPDNRSDRATGIHSRPHFPCFDGLRGLAALSILFLHTAYWSGFTNHSGYGGYIGRLEIGVSVFFLISGFLLYRPFAGSHLSGLPGPGLGTFWGRRLLRMVPAYWLALTVATYVFHAVTLGPGWQGVAANYGFAQIYFPSQIFNGILQAWSLCTEMSFYLFLPLYAAFVAFHRRSQVSQLVRELAGIAVLVLISFGFRYWALNQPVHCAPRCFTHPALVSLTSSWLPSYLDLFALGMLLAVLSAWFTTHESEPAWLRHAWMPRVSWLCAAVAFWAVAHLGISSQPIYVISTWTNLLKQSLYGVFAFFLLLPAVFGSQSDGFVRRLLRHWVVAAIGVISYGIYLWHTAWITEFLKWTDYKPFGVPFWFMLGAVLGLTVLAAAVSYFVVEAPALRLKSVVFPWNHPMNLRSGVLRATIAWRSRPSEGEPTGLPPKSTRRTARRSRRRRRSTVNPDRCTDVIIQTRSRR